MDKTILNKLIKVKEYPCVSIIFPTYRTAPDYQKNALRLKKLVREAGDKLETEFGKRDSKALVDSVKNLASKVDISHTLDGIALFVNKDIAEMVDIPFNVKERVIIDKTFATRDLIMGVNRGTNYYILDLSLYRARLLSCYRDHAEEINTNGFPMESEFTMLQLNPTDFSREKEKQIKEFFNKVDKAFLELYRDKPARLVISGVQKNLSLYREVVDIKDIVFEQIEGNHENTSVHDMGKKAWDLMRVKMKEERHLAISELQDAKSTKKFASGLPEIWRLAIEGRVQMLVVEQGFHIPAALSQDNILRIDTSGFEEHDVMPDAVDEVSEIVIGKGGKVVFVDDGSISEYKRIAAVLRY
jgi:hypothetical protein